MQILWVLSKYIAAAPLGLGTHDVHAWAFNVLLKAQALHPQVAPEGQTSQTALLLLKPLPVLHTAHSVVSVALQVTQGPAGLGVQAATQTPLRRT